MVLFLDEPTTGLDPAARLFVWDRIRALREAGVTIVLSTHSMEEAAALADRVGIVDSDRLLYVSEGMRAALVPGVPHIPGGICLLALVASLTVFGTLGIIGFRRRAID